MVITVSRVTSSKWIFWSKTLVHFLSEMTKKSIKSSNLRNWDQKMFETIIWSSKLLWTIFILRLTESGNHAWNLLQIQLHSKCCSMFCHEWTSILQALCWVQLTDLLHPSGLQRLNSLSTPRPPLKPSSICSSSVSYSASTERHYTVHYMILCRDCKSVWSEFIY